MRLVSDVRQMVTYKHQYIAAIGEFCAKIRVNLEHPPFEAKRRNLERLDVHGTLAVENGERILYLTCAIYPQQVSLVLTSPWLSNHKGHPHTITAKLLIGKSENYLQSL